MEVEIHLILLDWLKLQKIWMSNSQLIHSESKIPFEKIENCKTIGISSGASAPEILVDNFINELKKEFTVR